MVGNLVGCLKENTPAFAVKVCEEESQSKLVGGEVRCFSCFE